MGPKYNSRNKYFKMTSGSYNQFYIFKHTIKHTEEKSDRTTKKNIQIHNSSKRKISGKSPYLENRQHASK